MLTTRLLTVLALFTFTLPGCDDAEGAKTPAAEAGAKKADSPAEHAEAEAPGGKLAALRAQIDKGGAFEDALAKVEEKMGKSPLQQGEFWNFGEYDASGACVHMVLVRGGDKVQQVQFTTYEPGSSGFGWCAEMKIDKP
jgi:hypothetical protein